MPDLAPDPDPPPVKPLPPAPEDCCQGGCARCVFDLHADAVERYEVLLRQWEARRDATNPPAGNESPE